MLKLSDEAAKARLKWCLERQDKTNKYWNQIIFSDESKIHANQFARTFVWKYRGEWLDEKYWEK